MRPDVKTVLSCLADAAWSWNETRDFILVYLYSAYRTALFKWNVRTAMPQDRYQQTAYHADMYIGGRKRTIVSPSEFGSFQCRYVSSLQTVS